MCHVIKAANIYIAVISKYFSDRRFVVVWYLKWNWTFQQSWSNYRLRKTQEQVPSVLLCRLLSNDSSKRVWHCFLLILLINNIQTIELGMINWMENRSIALRSYYFLCPLTIHDTTFNYPILNAYMTLGCFHSLNIESHIIAKMCTFYRVYIS